MRVLAAALPTLMLLAACNKPNEPSTPTNPEPKASSDTQLGVPQDQGVGTTTTFESPNPEPAKPAQ
jgi:hypothetical protein